MKRILLAAPAVRVSCLVGDGLFCVFAAVWLWLAFSVGALLVVLLALALLAFYNVQVFRSAVLVDPVERTLTLTGLQGRTDDVSAADLVYTRQARVGQQDTRVIVVEDGAGRELSVITTLISLNKGYACETLARQLADALGIRFRPTVAPELYDREARREKDRRRQEQERQEKAERRQRRRSARRGEPPQASAPPEAPPVNYDEGDDEEGGDGP